MLENKVKRTDKQRDTTRNTMIPEVWRGGHCEEGRKLYTWNAPRGRKNRSGQPALESFVAVIPNFLLVHFIFGSPTGSANPCPRVEVPSFLLQGRGFYGGVESCERTKFNGP